MPTPNEIWRNYETDGVPDSGKWRPKKSEIRQHENEQDSRIASLEEAIGGAVDIGPAATAQSFASLIELKDADPLVVRSATLREAGYGGEYLLRLGTLPVIAEDVNFIASNTPGFYWERVPKSGYNLSQYVAAFFRSDADTTIDIYTSQDGSVFDRVNGAPLITVNGGGPVNGRDAGLFFFRGWWYIPITYYGNNGGSDIYDFALYRSRDLSLWEFIKCKLGSTAVYSETASSVGGMVPSNFLWAPKFFSWGSDLYVAISIRYNTDGTDYSGATVKRFRTFVSRCSNLNIMAFDAPNKIALSNDNFNTIDAQFYQMGARWMVPVKNEYTKNIELWRSDNASLFGNYSLHSVADFGVDVEAPALVNIRRGDSQNFWRLYADGYYTGLYYFKDSQDGGSTWGADQILVCDYATRHGNVLNIADMDTTGVASKAIEDFRQRSGSPSRRAPMRQVNLGNGAVNLVPDDDVLYFVNGSNNVTLNISSRGARRFFLAAFTGTGTAGITVSANARFPRQKTVGYGANHDTIVEVLLNNSGTGAQYYVKG